MPFCFSDKLIADIRAHYLSKYRKEISEDEAENYLRSNSTLFLTFAKVEAERRVRAEGGKAPPGPPPEAP